jgi:hypothetical protein
VARDVDLNGLVAGREVDEGELLIDSPECQRAGAGSYVLFAHASEGNGGLPPPVAAEFDFALVAAGTMFIGVGETVLDQIAWTSVEDAASTALDPAELDPDANDDEANWIACGNPYGDAELGNTGTPGASNARCSGSKAGTCMDGGKPRPIVSPVEGDILVTEALANPFGTGTAIDPGHEWFEIAALASFDLNGLEIGKGDAVEQTLSAAECLSVQDGDRLVFAESTDAGENGGIPQVDFIKSFVLNNTAGSVFVGVAGQVLHTLAYGNAADGLSRQLDPDGVTICGTPETDPYGTAGDRGTPGAANPDCP